MLKLGIMDVLDKEPANLEGSEPFAGFPPVFEGFSIIHIRSHLSDTQKLVAADNAEDKIDFRTLSFFDEALPSFSQKVLSAWSSSPNLIFNSLKDLEKSKLNIYFMNVIVIAASQNIELSFRRNAFNIKVRIVEAVKVREGFNNRLKISIILGSRELSGERTGGIHERIIISSSI